MQGKLHGIGQADIAGPSYCNFYYMQPIEIIRKIIIAVKKLIPWE